MRTGLRGPGAIRPDDAGLLDACYAKAPASDMRLRFFLLRREVPHSELTRYRAATAPPQARHRD